MRSQPGKFFAFVASFFLLLMLWAPAGAQNRSLRANTNTRPPNVVPTRLPGANSRFFRRQFAHVFNSHAAFSPFRHERFRQHERLEDVRRLALLNNFFYGGYQPNYALPYAGGYSSAGYGMPYMMGGYSQGYGGYPSSGYSSQPSYPSYGSSQMPPYSGDGSSSSYYSLPSYAGNAAASTGGASTSKQDKTTGKEDASPAKTLASRETGKILTAVGVPNDDGQLSYPLGLKVLQPGTENVQLLDQIETLFQLMAMQQAGGQVNPNFAQEANVAIDRLQTLLRGRQHNMMPNTYEEAQRYLEKLRHGLKVFEPSTTPES